MKKIFTVFSSLVLFQNIAFADDLTSSLSGVLKQPYEPSFISIIGALVFVVCLIYITGIVYAKLTAMSSKTVKKHIKNNTQVTILSTSDLGNGKTLHVIEIGGKQMLIGASSSSVNLLCELPEEILEEERKTEMEVEIVTEPKIIPNPEITEPSKEKKVEVNNDLDSGKEIINNVLFDELRREQEDSKTSDNNSNEDYGIYKKYLK